MPTTPIHCQVRNTNVGYVGSFRCMASECEVLLETDSSELAHEVTEAVAHEAARIESKYSRYDAQSVIGKINASDTRAVSVDSETANLLDFANTLFELSDAAFDITTGSLGKLWNFNGSDQVPDAAAIADKMVLVGWNKAQWNKPRLTLPKGMAIDFGGIGKEYAVDKAFEIACSITNVALLINFGGDLRANKAPSKLGAWSVGMSISNASNVIGLTNGALATSGDANRYLLKNGRRYSHILDARTGHSVTDAPTSVTVSAPTCIEAGMLSTLASLQGANAGDFLKAQGVRYWITDGNGSNTSFA